MSNKFALTIIMLLIFSARAFASNSDLLQEGKVALENGRYEEAVNYIGQILEKSGDVTLDSKVLALQRTTQAYGMLQLRDRSYDRDIEYKLLGAISLDPEWKYPKKLLDKLRQNTPSAEGAR